MMHAVIDSVTTGVLIALVQIHRLVRTLKQRAADVLAFFDRPGASNGPAEAIDGRVDTSAAPPSASGNLTNYVTRPRLDPGGFRPHLHPRLR